jgi:TPR repeat protein
MDSNSGKDDISGDVTGAEELHFQHFTVPVVNGHPVELGRGAMGITYKAYDRNLHVTVALKVINGAVLSSESARERFLREARSAAALRHPNVAAVFYLGEQEGSVFYAMEYVDGETIEAWIRREVGMPPVLALKIVGQVASALAAAQKEGIIHRDIKPSNIMLVESEDEELVVKVIDFGLAKSIESAPDSATVTLTQGGFLGTPHFASPEQLEEGVVDTRSDIYSLGVTLFYMLAGKTPFSGSMAQVMSQHLYRQPPLDLLEGQPAIVMELLSAMLAKSPEDRPQTATELRRRVEACLEELAFTGAGGESVRGPVAAPDAGEVVFGRFTLEERVGGAGEFLRFRATDANHPEAPAEVIVVDPTVTMVPGLREEVRQRVAVVERMRAPALRKVIAQGGAGRGWFFALERMDGVSLLSVMKSRRTLSLAEAVLILRPIADVVDAFDRASAARPELAPHEILLTPPAEPATPLQNWPNLAVKIDALRIENMLDVPADHTVVQSSVAVLRRATGGEGGSAAFAVAGLAYEVLGGTRFDAQHDHWTALAELTQGGNLVIQRGLESEFPTAAAFVEALAGEGSTILPAARPASPPVATNAMDSVEEHFRDEPKSPRRSLAVTGILVAAAAILGLGIFFVLSTHSSAPLVVEVTPTPTPIVPASPTPTPLVVSEPNQTPTATPGDSDRSGYAAEMEQARDLEIAGEDAAALSAYAKLVGEHRDDTELAAGMQRVAARIETNHPDGLTATDLTHFRESLEAAAWLGSPNAEVLLGNAFFKSDPSLSLEWLEMAAKQGRTDAMVKAGLMLSNGYGVAARDYESSAKWFQAAADRNDANGMTLLADCYVRGLGVAADPKRAVELATAAAALGNDRAMTILARLYEKGSGVPQSDPKKAFELYKRAADAGNLDAQANLGVLMITGRGTDADPAGAVRLWKEGAEKGNATCMYFYARTLEEDEKSDIREQAGAWYAKAAAAGSKEAQDWCLAHGVPGATPETTPSAEPGASPTPAATP